MSEPAPGSDKPADALTALPPQGVVPVGGRSRVTQRDLEMYAALVGVPHTLLLATEPARADPTLRIDAPRLSAWVRGLSLRAKQQFRQVKVRLASPGRKPRA